MQNNDDETAFPVAIGQTAADMKGMSLRDWFAGQVMQGLYANPNLREFTDSELASIAYKQANEMMEARKTLG
jgi:hypothetical protein